MKSSPAAAPLPTVRCSPTASKWAASTASARKKSSARSPKNALVIVSPDLPAAVLGTLQRTRVCQQPLKIRAATAAEGAHAEKRPGRPAPKKPFKRADFKAKDKVKKPKRKPAA